MATENTAAAAPTPRLEGLLASACYDYRNEPGYRMTTVRVGDWSVRLPLSEVYGALEKLAFARLQRDA